MKSGIVIIDKEKNATSQTVVSKVKKILDVKKAGHIGTLDPLATGVLPVLVGEATKLSKYLMEHDKTYRATVKLGVKKDTGDDEGVVVQRAEVGFLDEKMIANVLKEMEGKQKQAPHQFSAVKINGKKLYEYARKGEKIEIPKRDIEIYSTQILNINQKEKEISFEIACSKGTYIRVFCEDFAEKIGTVGFMKDLRRTKVGEFSIQNAVTLEKLNLSNLISVEKLAQNYGKIELNDRKLELFLNGVMLKILEKDGLYRVYNKQKFIGLGILKDEKLKRDIVITK